VKVPPLPTKSGESTSHHTHSHHGHHHHRDTFASTAGGGAAAATGVILFAFFACFILFTPPIQPSTLSSGLSNINGYHPAGDSHQPSFPSPQYARRPGARTILHSCTLLDRNKIDENECCICPGDILTPSTPNTHKEQSITIDGNGHIITPSLPSTSADIISVSTKVNDTMVADTLTNNNSPSTNTVPAPAA
jgi:hypothetical protein